MAKKVAETKAKPAPAAKPTAKAVAKPGAVKSAAAKPAAKAPEAAKPATPTTITVKQLSAAMAERSGMVKKETDGLIADIFSDVVDHLKAGERIRIGGLGIIEVKNRPARMGRNPATGEAIQIKASKKIAFRAAKELKEAI